MRLIGLVVVLTLGLTLAPLASEAQQKGKVWRIGFLGVGTAVSVDYGVNFFELWRRSMTYVDRFSRAPSLSIRQVLPALV
jgi:hypothetical protein